MPSVGKKKKEEATIETALVAMCGNISTHNDSEDPNVGNLHGVLVEGDGVEALGLLQDDGGGGTQASLTCVTATGGTAVSVKSDGQTSGAVLQRSKSTLNGL